MLCEITDRAIRVIFRVLEDLSGFNLGLGVTFFSHFEAGIYYNIPAGKTADFTWDKIGETLKDTSWNRAKSKTNAWHVAVAYYF